MYIKVNAITQHILFYSSSSQTTNTYVNKSGEKAYMPLVNNE